MRLMACSLPCIVIAVVASTAVAHAAPGSDELEVASPSAPDTNVVQPGNQTDPAVPLSTVLRDRLVRANDVPFETTHYVLTAGLLATGVGFELGHRGAVLAAAAAHRRRAFTTSPPTQADSVP